MSSLNLRQTIILVILFVITSVGFILLDNRRALDPFKDGLHGVTQPVIGLFQRIADGPRAPNSMEQELARVTEERDAFRAEAIRLRDAELENEQLRQQLGIESQYQQYTVLSAAVLNSDPTNTQKFITIDKGYNDGIREGMAVVDPNYVVGQVTQVEASSSRVTLIVDVTSTISARILSGGDGMLYGRWQVGGRLEMRFVDPDSAPAAGDPVLTSDNPNVQSLGVPGGLLIGEVGPEARLDPQRDELTLQIIPYCDFDTLKVVTVILGPRDPDAAPSATIDAETSTDNGEDGFDNEREDSLDDDELTASDEARRDEPIATDVGA